MLHVVCVRFGEAFGIEYVERLHDMVRRNLPAGFAGRFVGKPDDADTEGADSFAVELAAIDGYTVVPSHGNFVYAARAAGDDKDGHQSTPASFFSLATSSAVPCAAAVMMSRLPA